MADQLSQNVRFCIDDLLSSAPAFSQAGGEMGGAVADTQRVLQGLRNFWGDDAAGTRFGAFYAPNQARLLSLLGTVAAEVQGISDGITAMAAQFGVTEAVIVHDVRRAGEDAP